ncbi:MAG: hypothetical protein ACRD2J_08370, partial [Thermoanaerobaculia bacterium]
MKIQRSILAVTLALIPAAAFAQTVKETIQVTVVEVPVVVSDREGAPVRGLTKEDFEIFDQGKRVPVEYFEVVDLELVSAEDETVHPVANRNFLLLFDLTNSSPGNIGRSQEAAKEFVASQLGERDHVAVATYSV